VAIDYFTIRLGEDRHGESQLADAGPDPVDALAFLRGFRSEGFNLSTGQYSTRSLGHISMPGAIGSCCAVTVLPPAANSIIGALRRSVKYCKSKWLSTAKE
jgi:hypothetical protein